MATTVDTLLVEVRADLSKVNKSLKRLEKNTQRTQKKVSKSFSVMGKVGIAAFATIATQYLGRAAKASVDLASKVEEMQAKSSVVFGRFTKDVRKELTEFADEVGRSQFELEGMAASVQDTFVPMGLARGEAAALSVNMAKLATDVASFNNASDTETMKAFQSAMVGNHETVRRFGVVITEAALDAELFRMGIIKNKDEITAAEKVQARYNLILAGTTDAQGDAARTASSYANRVKAMDASLEKLGVAVGQELNPIFSTFVKLVTDSSDALTYLLSIGSEADDLSEIEKAQLKVAEAIDARVAAQQRLSEAKPTGFQQTFGITPSFGSEKLDLERAREREEAAKKELRVLQEVSKVRQAIAEAQAANAQGQQSDVAAKKINELLKEQGDAINIAKMRLEGYADSQIALQEVINQNGALTHDQTQQFLQQYEALKQLELQLAGVNEMNETIGRSIQMFASGVTDSIFNMMTGVTKGMEGMKDVFSNIVNLMIKKLIELLIVNKMVNAMVGFIAPTSTAAATPLPTLASGGSAMAGQPTLVGERGPELIIPKSASVVRNAHDTRNMMSGGSGVVVNQTNNFMTGVSGQVRQEVASLMPQIEERTKGAVAEQAARGGSYTRAF